MNASSEQVISGLEGVLACESSVTFLDGLADPSVLEYRGYNIHDIAETTSFEEIAHLMLVGTLPTAVELAAFDAKLKANRALPPEAARLLDMLPKAAHPMATLRTVVSLIGALDPRQEEKDGPANLAKAIRLTALFPTIVAAQHRVGQGQPIVEADPSLGHAAN